MRLPVILFFLIVVRFSVFGQEFTRDGFHHGMALRGKVLLVPGWDNVTYTNYSLGAELRFLKRHSLGIDWVYYRRQQSEDAFDSTGMEISTGLYDYDTRRYLHLDYRLYFALKDPYARVTPFINVFTKLGVRNATSDGSLYRYHESFQQYGCGIGMQVGFGDRGRCGLDVCAGMALHNGLVTRGPLPKGGTEVNKPSGGGAGYLRANLYFYLFRL